MKNITWGTAFFGYYFLLLKKRNWLDGIRDRNHQADAERDEGAKRGLAFTPNLAMALKIKPKV
jgi:hypothetical protein